MFAEFIRLPITSERRIIPGIWQWKGGRAIFHHSKSLKYIKYFPLESSWLIKENWMKKKETKHFFSIDRIALRLKKRRENKRNCQYNKMMETLVKQKFWCSCFTGMFLEGDQGVYTSSFQLEGEKIPKHSTRVWKLIVIVVYRFLVSNIYA